MSSDESKSRTPTLSENASVTLEHRSIRIGPLPDADEFARYERVLPGAAERILQRAEQQAAHRRALEQRVASADIARSESRFRLAFRGQTFALAMGLATLATCLAAALTGHDGAAIALAASSLVGVVAAFLGARLRDAGAREKGDDTR